MSTKQGQFYSPTCENRTGIFNRVLAFLVWRALAFEVCSYTPASQLSLWIFNLTLSGNSAVLHRQTTLNLVVLRLSRKVREHFLFQFQYPLPNDSYWAEHDLSAAVFKRDYKSPGLSHMWGFKNWCPSCWDLPPPPVPSLMLIRTYACGCVCMSMCVSQPQPWTFSFLSLQS